MHEVRYLTKMYLDCLDEHRRIHSGIVTPLDAKWNVRRRERKTTTCFQHTEGTGDKLIGDDAFLANGRKGGSELTLKLP
jgi:hypothetical protein